MKEKPNQDSRAHKTAEAPSFHTIDPQNWPDLPPLPTKPRQHRNPYKLLGVAHFTDQTVQYGATSGMPPGWRIPQSELVEPTNESPIKKRTDEERKVEAKMRRARLQAKELMLKLHSGQVDRSQVLLFYKKNATAFISPRTYESYRDYAIKHKLKIMSWPEYARAVILRKFSEDFYAFRRL